MSPVREDFKHFLPHLTYTVKARGEKKKRLKPPFEFLGAVCWGFAVGNPVIL